MEQQQQVLGHVNGEKCSDTNTYLHISDNFSILPKNGFHGVVSRKSNIIGFLTSIVQCMSNT